MNILIIGGGGRENVTAWKAKQNPNVQRIFVAPGNAGTSDYGENVPIGIKDVGALTQFAKANNVGLTIVGSEDALEAGIVDEFQALGLRIFGPTRMAAQIESSKLFMNSLLTQVGVARPRSWVFADSRAAVEFVRSYRKPVVVKADGLCAGKGAVICSTFEKAEQTLVDFMENKVHKYAGTVVVIEEFLNGPEISVHTLCSKSGFYSLPLIQDHKPALDGDAGEMTGGMGTISPLPWVTTAMIGSIREDIVRPTIEAMKHNGTPFEGLMYHGLKSTSDGLKVLEINARFGDTEAQTLMRRLKTDFVDMINACVDDKLSQCNIGWDPGFAVTIVLSAGGYPGKYVKGTPIYGVEDANKVPGVVVFHAGTKRREDGVLVTDGGRVLNVTATGNTLEQALQTAYKAADLIQFEGKHCRRDIGAKSLAMARG